MINEEFYATGPSSSAPTLPRCLLAGLREHSSPEGLRHRGKRQLAFLTPSLSFSNCSASTVEAFASTSGVHKASSARIVLLASLFMASSQSYIFVFFFGVFGPSFGFGFCFLASSFQPFVFFFLLHFLTSASPASSVVFFLIILHAV
jgi:hypothetical protein